VSSIRRFLTPANAMTSTNLLAGFLGLVAVADAHLVLAASLVVLAAICDSLDGTIARRTGRDGAFGTNLDSLADLVSFGVVPAMALYMGPLNSRPILGLTACSGFVLAAAWRLARFPLVKRCDYFLGVPVPVTGVLLMLMLLSRPGFGLAVVATLTASALMLSTLRFPTLRGVGRATSIVIRGDYRRRLHKRVQRGAGEEYRARD
jgi:CDP-diacylglycerol---serine O-phosphatidyltransferase